MERKFEVGQRVRHQEYGEGTVIQISRFYTDVLIKFDNGENYWFSDDNGIVYYRLSTLTPIPATISTPEMITALMENPILKAKCSSDSILLLHGNRFVWESDGSEFMFHRRKLDRRWTLIYPPSPKPVEFLEAVNSGKRIKPVDMFTNFKELADWFRILEQSSHGYMKHLINGKWLISDAQEQS